jgi:hypothetical protein
MCVISLDISLIIPTSKLKGGFISPYTSSPDLYVCKKQLREEHRLRVFENGVLRIFGHKREKDESWRKLHTNGLHGLFSSPNIVRVIKSRRLRWAGHVARTGEGRGVYRVFVGSPKDKSPLGRPRRMSEDNISWTLGI